ncbi:hypothetical protein [Flavobacterium sp. LB2P53]|uniref:hypothetical protein n=1 Tax=Flavobacterium sp. LB2P53 TaxID=2497481 RepID=UPI000F82EDC3|nr:hypothetical protein [Flavobacterium sp. LB2P53]RTY67071.1 hypothetical protein EKL95_09835 [Flavobacterium sp. LB2P53]
MEIKFKEYHKLIITFICFLIAIVGFMIKLPVVFRHYDKELHSMFCFIAALFLNVLFVKRQLFIFIFLFLFGVTIEISQQYSNKFFGKKIHGRFDKEDVYSNLKGLILFSIIWLLISFIHYLFKSKQNH